MRSLAVGTATELKKDRTMFHGKQFLLLTLFVSTIARAGTPVTITIDASNSGATTSPTFAGLSFETALMLPNNASVSELLVHCQFEPML